MKNFLDVFRKSREINNASWIISCRIMQMALSFVVSVISARFLGPSNYGLISYGGAYVAFFSSFCTLGLHSVVVRDIIDDPNDQGKTLGTALAMRLVSSSMSILIIAIIVSLVDKGESMTIHVVILCSLMLLFQVFDTFNYWFQSRYESKISSIAALIAYGLSSVYKIAVLILQKNVLWFACATSIDYAFIALFLYVAYRQKKGPSLSISAGKAKSMIKRSYHYILAGMMSVIYGQIDKIMLKHMLDEEAVGLYSLGTSINSMWVFVLVAIIDSMYPTILQLHKTSKEAFEKKNRQLYAIVIYVSVFVGLVFLLFGKWVIGLLYGQEYLGAAAPLKVIVWYTIFSYLGVARNAWIVCENKQKYLKYMYFAAAVINVVLNFLMIPRWGSIGAAAASLITQIFTSILLPLCIPALQPNAKLMLEAILLKKVK